MKSAIGDALAKFRAQAGWKNRDEAAAALGLSVNALGNYERGERDPPIDFLAHFARITGADLVELINLRLAAGGFEPIAARVGEAAGVYRSAGDPDAAAYARQALLAVPDFPRPWCLAIMEMAARGEITPSGVDRLIGLIRAECAP